MVHSLLERSTHPGAVDPPVKRRSSDLFSTRPPLVTTPQIARSQENTIVLSGVVKQGPSGSVLIIPSSRKESIIIHLWSLAI